MPVPLDEVRKINLIDILEEEHPECQPPPEYAVTLWSEEQIREYFAAEGTILVELPKPVQGRSTGPVRYQATTCKRGVQANLTPAIDGQILEKFPAPSEDSFKKAFPGLKLSQT
eukprot:scaffold1862_cov576-Prasinococcus_capsulatus_cf.AAC.14